MQPSDQLEWTGERYVPQLGGEIGLEHTHRYLLAARHAAGKTVLDIACGEGYGSSLLSAHARQVIGVDIDFKTVEHATRKYRDPRISFCVGSAVDIPVRSASIDLIASFETIEHHAYHAEMLQEFVRVLKPDGLVVISSPDREAYGKVSPEDNPFHIKELSTQEFRTLLGQYFKYTFFLGQRVHYGSMVATLDGAPAPAVTFTLDETGAQHQDPGLREPIYIVAFAANTPFAFAPAGGLYWSPTVGQWTAETARLHEMEKIVVELRNQQIVEQGIFTEQNERLAAASHTIALRDQEIVRLDQERSAIQQEAFRLGLEQARLEQEVVRLSEERAHFERAVARLGQEVIVLERAQAGFAAFRSDLAIARSVLSDRNRELERLRQSLDTQRAEGLIARHDLATKTLEVARLQESLAEYAAESKRLKKEIELLYTSRSWKLTAPLRAIHRSTTHPEEFYWRGQRMAGRILRFTYRRLPVSEPSRHRIKNIVFAHGGFLLKRTNAYRFWEAQQKIAGMALPADEAAYSEQMVFARSAEKDRIQSFRPTPTDLLVPPTDTLDTQTRSIRFRAVADPLVSIVIPVHNHVQLTLLCLASILRYHTTSSFEVIIVDDASTDETARLLPTIPGIQYLRNQENLGFIRTCNYGATVARGEFIVFLNNDVQVAERWLDELIAVHRSAPDVGAVGPKLVYPNGRLQEAGVTLNADCSSTLVGLADDPSLPAFSYTREIDYCSGACLLLKTRLFRELGGFDEALAPSYCEDVDLCLRIRQHGLKIVYAASAVIFHHLSATSTQLKPRYKQWWIVQNQQKLAERWQEKIDALNSVRLICFYLPQFHPIPENDRWWGEGFTEWVNVRKAQPNFIGHKQPIIPTDLGFYDLRTPGVMEAQADLARRYGIYGFCFYYYWFAGKRLLELPVDRLLSTGRPDFPFCLCWANENWTRRWDGHDTEILIAQDHSAADDYAVIEDLMRYMRAPNYIRVHGKPLLLVYRVGLFPEIAATAERWRKACRAGGIGEIYLVSVESHEAAVQSIDPRSFGFDAAVEFPPHHLASLADPPPVLNPDFRGRIYDYPKLVRTYLNRRLPGYPFFRGVAPRWDNTARRQNMADIFVGSSPGAYRAWLEIMIEQTRHMRHSDEQIVFINSWNEWAEGAHLEPDNIAGYGYLEATRNALDARLLVRDTG